MSRFDNIRPYSDDEVPQVISRLLDNNEFIALIGKFTLPQLSRFLPPLSRLLIRKILRNQLRGVSNIRDWQNIAAKYAKRLISTSMDEIVYEGLEEIDKSDPHIFISNHRDIAGDSMLVDYGLHSRGGRTVRIAVGDNLIQKDFATDLMKLNKSFFIQRSVEGVKNMLRALTLSSEYIHHSLEEGESIWIAQSEGRSKDGIDVTDPAIIKMFALAKRKQDFSAVINSLNIVPVSISYEFDPCDLYKARELAVKEAEGKYDKPEGEDLLSLVIGLSGYKGRVILRFGKKLQGEFFSAEDVAEKIDGQIIDLYQLFPVNYYALSLYDEKLFNECVPEELRNQKEQVTDSRFDKRLAECPEDHRRKLIEMYANPVISKCRIQNALVTNAESL